MVQYRKLVNLNQCAKCGSKNRLEVHHLDHDRDNNSLSNLLVLCASDHKKLHYNSWSLDEIGIKQPIIKPIDISKNPCLMENYTLTTADIQKELDLMGDPITDIMKFD